MGDVIDLGKAKEEREPHIRGTARCLECSHQWEAVAPLGTFNLFECPECRTHKGVLTGPFVPELRLECECGNQLFFVTPEGYQCPRCGVEDDWEE